MCRQLLKRKLDVEKELGREVTKRRINRRKNKGSQKFTSTKCRSSSNRIVVNNVAILKKESPLKSHSLLTHVVTIILNQYPLNFLDVGKGTFSANNMLTVVVSSVYDHDSANFALFMKDNFASPMKRTMN